MADYLTNDLAYSHIGGPFLFLHLQVFNGNSDQNSIVVNTLDPPIMARFIRVQPVKYYGWMSLRMELYGCRSGGNLFVFFKLSLYIK